MILKGMVNTMGKNFLVEALRNNNTKSNYFDCNASVISYKTGFPVLDYYLGYKVNVFDKDNNLTDSYSSIGITAGSYIEFIGKPSTSKTTTAVQIAANIVRDFDNGVVIHFDLEQAMNYTRIQTLTKFKMTDMSEGKYILRQEKTTLEDMKKTIMDLYREKTNNPETYKYNTGKYNEFGEEITLYVPSVIIIDSIATITMSLNENDKKDLAKLEEVGTQTDRMRLTGEIGRFFNEIMPYIRTANITLIAINQIKTNPNMGIVKSPAELLYLTPDEHLPGGLAPQFLAHVLIKFIAVGSKKYTEEEDGFDGFGVDLRIIKSRTNQAGQTIPLIYDKVRGIDSLRSSVNYAKEIGILGGNRNGYYIGDNKDNKFTLRNMHQDFKNNRELYKILYGNIIPVLESRLSAISPEEMEIPEEEMDY
jgi:RecA/RadA recombinase